MLSKESRKDFRVVATVVVLAVVGLAVFFVYSDKDRRGEVDGGKFGGAPQLKVAASFYPLAHFAEQIGGDRVEVAVITPGGVEPHDYEPAPQEIILAGKADLFVYNGGGLDPWAERLAKQRAEKGKPTFRAMDLISEDADGGGDPHFWLDPALAQSVVAGISDALAAADPLAAKIYERQAGEYIVRLEDTDKEYKTGLSNCARRDVVVSHDAFGYPAARYGLKLHAIAGFSPEEEPSAKRLAELVDLVKFKGITHIFFETLVSPKLAETIARETGAKTAVLNPIEGLTEDEETAGENYDSLMRRNLDSLREALGCAGV